MLLFNKPGISQQDGLSLPLLADIIATPSIPPLGEI